MTASIFLKTATFVIAAVGSAAVLVACSTQSRADKPQEAFASTQTYTRTFDAPAAQTCEASRRALLSQGYVVNTARADLVEGRKNFQPQPESHMQMEVRVVCAPESEGGNRSMIFVTALQDSYALKKSNNSASLGVGLLGSVSLPFSSSSDAMVKIASETVSSRPFYDSFFDLVRRYLSVTAAEQPAKSP
jgi:hypothetical protein